MTDSNKHDKGKIRPTLIPTSVLRYISKVREYGLNKYPDTGKEGWKEVGRERFADALFRHLIDYIEDPSSVDEESGLPTIAHIACNAAFLCFYDELYFNGLNRKGNEYERICNERRVSEALASDSFGICGDRSGSGCLPLGEELDQGPRDSEEQGERKSSN